MILNSPQSILEDPNLIVQRLDILLQMLKISEPEEIKKEDKAGQSDQFSSKTYYSPVSQNTQVLAKRRKYNSRMNRINLMKIVHQNSQDSSTIKTLRVDTRKAG